MSIVAPVCGVIRLFGTLIVHSPVPSVVPVPIRRLPRWARTVDPAGRLSLPWMTQSQRLFWNSQIACRATIERVSVTVAVLLVDRPSVAL